MPTARTSPATAAAAIFASLLVVASVSALVLGASTSGPSGAAREGVAPPWAYGASAPTSRPGGLSLVSNVRVGTAPELAAVNTSGGDVYVANSGSGNVSILNATSLVGTVNVSTAGADPWEPIYDPVNASEFLTYHAYVFPHVLTLLHGPLSGGTLTVGHVAGITVDDELELGVYDPVTTYTYVTDNGVTVGVAVINSTTQTRIATAPTGLGSLPRDLTVDPQNGWVYVVDLFSHQLTVVSGLAALATVPLPAVLNATHPTLALSRGAFAPDYSSDIAFDPADGEIYVADAGADSVSVVDLLGVVKNVSVGAFPYSVAYDPADAEVYVTNIESGNVSVLQGTSVVASVPAGMFPVDATYDAADGDMLVANLNSSDISVLNGTTSLGTVVVGADPVFQVYDRVNGNAYVVNYGSNNATILAVPSSSVSSGLPPWEWGVLVVVVILVLAAILLAFLLRRRRRGTAVGPPKEFTVPSPGTGPPTPSPGGPTPAPGQSSGPPTS